MTPAHHSVIDMKQVSAYSSAPAAKLTPKQELFKLEEEIELHWASSGAKLQIIHDRELWRADGYTSWKDYCEKRWHKNRRTMYQLLDSAEVAQDVAKQIEDSKVSTMEDTPCEIANERQARALKNVPSEQRLKVLKKAGDNGKVTAIKINEAASDVLENGEAVSDYKRTRKPSTESGKPKWSHRLWRELEADYGHALNRIDEANRVVPDAKRHARMLAATKQLMGEARDWRDQCRIK